jgi:hypothetical protein
LSFPIIAASGRVDSEKFPKLKAYATRIETHEGYVGAVKKMEDLTGMPFELRP